jgi:hypothetical protein
MWSSLGAAVVMLLVASALAWNDEHKRTLVLEADVQSLKLVPAQFKLKPIELRRNDLSSTAKRDVFLPVKVELIAPLEVDIDGYTLEISRDGVIEEFGVGNDVSEWNLYIDSSFNSMPMRSLPKKLRSGRGAEGWLHFITEKTNYELDSGRLTLSVHTSRGDGHVVIPCTFEYWNPTRTTMIMPRY